MADIRYNNEFCLVTESGQPILCELLSGRVETNQPISKFTPKNDVLELTGLTSEMVDMALVDISKKEVPVNVVWIESEPRTQASDEAVEKLNNSGVTVITVKI